MNEKLLNRIMLTLMVVGSLFVLFGVGLILFTDIYLTWGVNGVATIAGVIALGLFLLVPSKIYLTLQLMQQKKK
jgi:multisubunit Na+/H+ antiporter MnhG subunit